ncbi:hypothetical protein [Streptomyces sp. NPDC002132]|uniref:hypothetical protein n=1 Tax=unclassified Streptomyces TaxID=2593676 RepID=UPI00331E9396
MTGPEHYREGERLLAASEDTTIAFGADTARALAAQAQAHFLAALVATTAVSQHPDSVAWDKVINQ